MYYELDSCNCYIPNGFFYYINQHYRSPCYKSIVNTPTHNIRVSVQALPKGTSDIKFQPFILLV